MDFESVLSSPSRLAGAQLAGPLATDERLAKLVGRGDERAFRLLYDRYSRPLYRYCLWLLRNEADAEDALQCAFLSAVQSLKREPRDVPVRPWLFRIAHNESISLVRRRRPDQELSSGRAACSASVEDQVEERERVAMLVGDLRELPERQRAALLMRELSGLSHKEIALALGASVAAAKQSIFEARRSLHEFTEGRAMNCEELRRLISDADGRVLRGRRVRAHVRHCSGCAAFAAAIDDRSRQFKALAPGFPPTAAAGLLARSALGSLGAGDAGSVAVGGFSKSVALGVGAATKALTTLTALFAVGTSIELPQMLAHRSPHSHASASAQQARDAGGRALSRGQPPSSGVAVASGEGAVAYETGAPRPVATVRNRHGTLAIGLAPGSRQASNTTTGSTRHTGGRHGVSEQRNPKGSSGQTGNHASPPASSSHTGTGNDGNGGNEPSDGDSDNSQGGSLDAGTQANGSGGSAGGGQTTEEQDGNGNASRQDASTTGQSGNSQGDASGSSKLGKQTNAGDTSSATTGTSAVQPTVAAPASSAPPAAVKSSPRAPNVSSCAPSSSECAGSAASDSSQGDNGG